MRQFKGFFKMENRVVYLERLTTDQVKCGECGDPAIFSVLETIDGGVWYWCGVSHTGA